MPTPIDELITPVTEEQMLESFLDILESLSIPARSWRVGGSLRTILRVAARIFAGFTTLMALAIRSGFLDLAEDVWLTWLAYYVYGVTRIEATFATGQLQLTNTGGGSFTYDPEEVRALNPATGKSFVNTETFTINPGDTVLVDFQAVEAGRASSSAANTITELETTILGVSVTNPTALVGVDDEQDEPLRQRCRDKLASLSPDGPRGAYRYAVLSALRDDGTPVDINRVAVSPNPATGVVTIYAASPSGTPTAGDLEDAEESIELIARPDTVTANLVGATTAALASSLTVWAKKTAGIDADDLETAIEAALEQAVAAYPIGGLAKPPSQQGYLYGDYIAGVVESADASIFDVDGTSDLALSPGQVATLAVTLDIRIVDAP